MRNPRMLVVMVLGVGGLLAGCCLPGGGTPPPTTTSTSSSSSSSTSSSTSSTTSTTLGTAVLTVVVPDITLNCDGQSCQGATIITVTNTGTGPTTVAPVLSGGFDISQGNCGNSVLGVGASCAGSISVATIDPNGPVSTGGTVTATAGSVSGSDSFTATNGI